MTEKLCSFACAVKNFKALHNQSHVQYILGVAATEQLCSSKQRVFGESSSVARKKFWDEQQYLVGTQTLEAQNNKICYKYGGHGASGSPATPRGESD